MRLRPANIGVINRRDSFSTATAAALTNGKERNNKLLDRVVPYQRADHVSHGDAEARRIDSRNVLRSASHPGAARRIRARPGIGVSFLGVEAPGSQGARSEHSRDYVSDEQRRQPGCI